MAFWAQIYTYSIVFCRSLGHIYTLRSLVEMEVPALGICHRPEIANVIYIIYLLDNGINDWGARLLINHGGALLLINPRWCARLVGTYLTGRFFGSCLASVAG